MNTLIIDQIDRLKDQENGVLILNYLCSDDPGEIDRGIRDTIRGLGLSILAIGLGLARVKSEKLFLQLNYKNITAYIEDLSKNTKSDRGNIFSWLKIGETYLKYQDELELIGFSDENGPTKLPYLERALAKGPRDEVFDKLKNMSLREFKAFARSAKAEDRENTPFWELRGNILYIDGQRAIILNRKLGLKNTDMLRSAICLACRALEKNGYVVAVHLRNRREARRFRAAAKRVRARIQSA